MASELMSDADPKDAPRRTIWAAPFVLLLAVGAGLAAAYPNLRPGTETVADDAVPLPAVLRPLGQPAETAVADGAQSAPTDNGGAVARVVSGNAHSVETDDPDPHGTVTRVDIASAEETAVAANMPVAVVRGRGQQPEPATEASGDDAAAEEAIAVAPVTVAGVSFGLCRETPYTDCVVDGDTFYHRGQSIRIADIDAAEVFSPGCMHEAELGTRATYRLLALLNGGRFELAPAEGPATDDYGRALRLVLRDGRSLGGTLVHEGLARAWDGPPMRWCG